MENIVANILILFITSSNCASVINRTSSPVKTSLSATLQPRLFATDTAVPFKSPVIITTLTPCVSMFFIAKGISSRIGSKKDKIPSNVISPATINIYDKKVAIFIWDEKPEAIFQVEARPTAVNIGNYMTLIEETRITGRDEFTDITITGTDLPATTRLPDDNTVSQNDGKVIQ